MPFRASAGDRHRTPVPGLILAVVALALGAGPALATTGHSYAGQFGAAGNGDGELGGGGPSGIAVLQSSGDVFVSDPGHTLVDGTPDPRIERFDAAGSFQSAFPVDGAAYSSPGALAVDPAGAGAVYVAAIENATGLPAVLKFSAAGVLAHALDASSSGTSINYGTPVAVDPVDGTVYVTAADSTSGTQVIEAFDGGTGAFVSSFDGTAGAPGGAGFACPTGLAIDAAHRLSVFDPCTSRVAQYATTGTFTATIDDGTTRGAPVAVAADPVSGEVVVAESGPAGLQITPFDPATGAPGQTFGAANVGGLGGLAVDHGSGTVYTADNAAGVVERFATFVGPTVTTSAAAPVGARSATLNGTVDPGGVAATYHFDYGSDTAYGASTADTSAGSGTGAAAAAAAVAGLTPNTSYHFRAVAANGAGTIVGDDRTFTTAPVAPVVDGAPAFASAITRTSARINATINPNHSATTFHVDYGGSTAYGLTSPQPDADAGSANADTGVATTLTGLTPGTTYHFRVVADNGTGGAQHGADGTFTTDAPGTFVPPPAPPAPPGGPSASYGCAAPHLDAYRSRPRPGDTIAITGSDLGVGGTVAFGDRSFTPADWSASGFAVRVPDGAAGSLPLTVDCGQVSNTIAVAIAPDNSLSITRTTVSGSTAGVSVRVPGPGRIVTLANGARATTRTVTRAGVVTIELRLTAAGARALKRARSRTLEVTVRVRFTPTGGEAGHATRVLTFKRKAGH